MQIEIFLNNQSSNRRSAVWIFEFGYCDLPFGLAQGGEPVEPFVFWNL
jgi:hypothetical protein